MTITSLTIRQFLKSRSLAVVAVICLIPLAVAIIPHLVSNEPSIRSLRQTMSNTIFLGLYTSLLLPISVMVLSSASIGDEIDDKTLYLLALKPVSRFRIVLEKFLAIVAVVVPILWISVVIVWAVHSWGRFDQLSDMIWPMLAGCLVGVVGFGSIFLAVSLVIRRTLLFGMFYVTIWEGALSQFLPGIRSFSISHYSRSMFVELLGDDRITIDNPAGVTRVVVTTIVIMLASLGLATWRLRRMAID